MDNILCVCVNTLILLLLTNVQYSNTIYKCNVWYCVCLCNVNAVMTTMSEMIMILVILMQWYSMIQYYSISNIV